MTHYLKFFRPADRSGERTDSRTRGESSHLRQSRIIDGRRGYPSGPPTSTARTRRSHRSSGRPGHVASIPIRAHDGL